MHKKLAITLSTFALITSVSSAYAACTTPAGIAGEIIYNTDHNVLQYCDDTRWVGMGWKNNLTAQGSTGNLQFKGSDDKLSANANLTWDITNNRLGIGTSTPSERLTVYGSTNAAPATIALHASRHDAQNVEIARISVRNSDPSDLARISMFRGTGQNEGRIMFYTNPSNTSTSPIERMRITEAGRVLIGTSDTDLYNKTSGNGGIEFKPKIGTDGAAIQVANGYGEGWSNLYLAKYGTYTANQRYVAFWSNNVQIGTISASSTTSVAYNTTSDYRLKENISPVQDALSRVRTLKPVAYNYKTDPTNKQEGFIAHEAQSITPYAVTGEKDAVDNKGAPIYQQLDYAKLTPLLAAAIQDLAAENEKLRESNEALTQELKSINSRLDALTAQ